MRGKNIRFIINITFEAEMKHYRKIRVFIRRCDALLSRVMIFATGFLLKTVFFLS